MSSSRSRFYPLTPQRILRQLWAINAPLTITGIAMMILLICTIAGVFLDAQVITGAPAWLKPSKFAFSVALYAFTFVWLLSYVQGHPRLVTLATNLTALAFVIEMGIIVAQAARGTTSHFNVSSPLDSGLWVTMAITIITLWAMTLLAIVLLVFQRLNDPAWAWSLRLALMVTFLGMGVAFLMTGPTPQQQAAQAAGHVVSIIGAHSVGVADGGPGLPLLTWSTRGGDLRVPHFVGLHALQILPLLGWLIIWRSSPRRLDKRHQVALVWTAGLAYTGLILLLTWQALRGQSVVAPDALTLVALAGLIAAMVLAVTFIMLHARRQATRDEEMRPEA
jgi:hypothetical protein